jgi:hypothetical protein
LPGRGIDQVVEKKLVSDTGLEPAVSPVWWKRREPSRGDLVTAVLDDATGS